MAGDRVFVCDRILVRASKASITAGTAKIHFEGPNESCASMPTRAGSSGNTSTPAVTRSVIPRGRATPTVEAGKVYTLGAMGDLRCLDADNGRVLWSRNYSRDLGTEMNLWGMAAAPLVDGDRLIVLAGGKNHAGLVALERHSGRELWRALDCPDPGYSVPVIIESGGVRQLLVWCPTGLYSVDPATGKVFWSEPADVKFGHSIALPIFDPKRGLVFVTSFFNGPLMMKLAPARPAASLLWKGNSSSELPANGGASRVDGHARLSRRLCLRCVQLRALAVPGCS